MALTSKQRATLRAAAHHLTAAVHVGHQGLSETLRGSVDDALRTRELVKIQFSKTTDVDVKGAASELASTLGADVVQVIGRTATLFREKVDEE